MIEIILGICLAVGFIGLLAYLYYHEKSEREYIKKIQYDLTSLPIQLQKFYADISERDTARTQRLIDNCFTKYLKHIEKLERMTLPKQVTVKDVQSVLNRTDEIVDENLENEIEKAEKESEFTDNTWVGHIKADTKVAFEGDDIPTVIE